MDGYRFEDGKSVYRNESSSTVYDYECRALDPNALTTDRVWLCKRTVFATGTERFANGVDNFLKKEKLMTVSECLSATYPELEADDALLAGKATEVQLSHLLQGELEQFNRFAGGAIVTDVEVSADGVVYTGACIYYGTICDTAGDMVAIYDNVAASGKLRMGAQTGVANTFYGVPGVGIECANGLYANWTSGTWRVLLVPGV